MIPLRLGAALVSVCLGVVLCTRRKQPLFFKILLFAAASYLLGALFEGCWELIYGNAPGGFHIGCLGYVGMWFFLFSSYFGAIDRLADGGEPMYRPYRLAALAAPLAVLGLTAWSMTSYGPDASLPLPLPLDEDGFVMGGEEAGIFAAGCARMPLDVMRTAQSGTAAALKAVQTVKGR